MSNNFDQSSTGINIEALVMRDAYQAQANFKDYLKPWGRMWIYTPFGETFEPEIKVGRNNKKANLLDALDNITGHCYDGFSHGELCDACDDLTDEEKRTELGEYDVKTITNYDTIHITGYCQGDYATIVFDKRLKKEHKPTKDWLGNLFYDQPVYARFTINEVEYFPDKFEGYNVEWDADKVIECIMAQVADKTLDRDVLRTELKSVTPATIEY